MDGANVDAAKLTVPKLGIVSRTLIRSPAVRWIFSVRLRSEEQHEVLMFGDDFIHIKEIDANGRLCHLATLDSFNSPIRSGGVLGIETTFKKHPPLAIEDEDIKVEEGLEKGPPQFMVISTSDPPELRFLIAEDRRARPLRFHERIRALPDLDAHTLRQPGSLIAVDPCSRCFAVAADAENLIVYLVQDLAELMTTFNEDKAAWNPVRDEQILRVGGTILRMHFLRSGNDSPNSVTLVLVVGSNNRTSIKWFIWDFDDDHKLLEDALRNPNARPYNHRLSQDLDTPQLLIPSQHSPSFVMIYHNYFVMATQAMSDQLQITEPIDFGLSPDKEPRFPAVSGKLPVWTGWSKGISNDKWGDNTKEGFYIVREDGEMFYFTAAPMSMTSSSLGAFQGYVDQGFACCEVDTSLRKPYFMVSAGVMSPGEVKQIGKNGETPHGGERSVALATYTVDMIDNWTPTKDLILSDLGSSSQTSGPGQRTGIYMTAGRGPRHGAIVEMNKGLAAHISTHFSIQSVQSTALWMLEDLHDSVFVIVSLPEETMAFHLPSDYSDVTALPDGEDCDLRLDRPTLFTSMLASGHMVQVTSTEIVLLECDGLKLREQSTFSGYGPLGSTIVAAALDSEHGLCIIALRDSLGFEVRVVDVALILRDPSAATPDLQVGEPSRLPIEPTSLVTFRRYGAIHVAVSTADGRLQVFRIHDSRTMQNILNYTFSANTGGDTGLQNICGSIAVLSDDTTHSPTMALVCGMRDGRVVVLEVVSSDDHRDDVPPAGTLRQLSGPGHRLRVSGTLIERLGNTPVNVSMDHSGASLHVYATCESTILRATIHSGLGTVAYDRVVFTPKLHASDHQPLRGLSSIISVPDQPHRLAIIRDDTVVIAHVDQQVAAVPLTLGLKNTTPELIIYCERLSAFIVASTKIKLQRAPVPNSRWRGRRMTYAQIDIISTAHDLDEVGKPLRLGKLKLWPGERINAMLDWKFRDAQGKKHAQLVVATSLAAHSSSLMKGRLLFLTLKREEEGNMIDIVPIKDSLYEEPVRGIAEYSPRELVIATGCKVQVIRLVIDASGARWVRVCRKELRSPAVHLTAEAPYIHISTTDESVMIMRLTTRPSTEDRENDDESDDDRNDGGQERPEAASNETLELVFTDKEAKDVAHHLPLKLKIALPVQRDQDDAMDIDGDDGEDGRTNVLLLSDRGSCALTGLYIPPHATLGTAMPDLFEARLPRTLMRIAQGPVRPSWRQMPKDAPGAQSVLVDDLLGASVDGEIYQFSIVDEHAWKVLRVLEGAARLRELLQADAAGRYVHEDEWEAATRLPVGMGSDDMTSFHIDGNRLARHITTQASMEELVRYSLQHDRYRGPDAGVFAGDIRRLLDLRNGCGADETLAGLHAWYTSVMMPML